MALYLVGHFFLDAAQKQALRDNLPIWIAGMLLLMLCCFIEHEFEQALQPYDCMEQTQSVCSLDEPRWNAECGSCLPWRLRANRARFMGLIGMKWGGYLGREFDAIAMPLGCDRDATGTPSRCDWDTTAMRLGHDRDAIRVRSRCDWDAIAVRIGTRSGRAWDESHVYR